MSEELAKKMSNAIAQTEHDLLKFETELSQKRIEWIDKYLLEYLKKGGILVDLGCGSGKQMFKIEKLGINVIGIEISEGMIKWAERNKKLLKSNAKIIEASYFNIPLKNNSVDYVLFPLNIVECSYNEFEKVVNEVLRIMNNKGKFFMTMQENIKRQNVTTEKDKYNVMEGCYNGEISTPNENDIKYPTYMWTIAFAHYIISKKLKLKDIIKMENEETYLLTYEKVE
jgi:ubiquinone/menaquinone biosynthesis C-methylase UbiE